MHNRSLPTPTSPLPPGGAHPGLAEVEKLAKIMDSQFRLPGTGFRFGFDGILGLIPGVGDLGTFGASGYMLWIMARNGASGNVMSRMVLNVVLDVLIGSIPVLGDVFDFFYKANLRNLALMREHYQEGRHRGSAWRVILPVLLVLFFVVAGGILLAAWLLSELLGGVNLW